jgi:AAA domain, putative AbiEii toxin, Type IV TA system
MPSMSGARAGSFLDRRVAEPLGKLPMRRRFLYDADRMTPPTKRSVLAALSKPRLQELAVKLGLSLGNVGKPKLIDGVARSGATLADVAAMLERSELVQACRAHGLPDTGRSKRELIDRLIGEAAASEGDQTPGYAWASQAEGLSYASDATARDQRHQYNVSLAQDRAGASTGTLRRIDLQHVGPASAMSITFGGRLNFFVGDNGLGKSFVLDVAWWALTRTWARGLVMPHPPPAKPKIEYEYLTQNGRLHHHVSQFDRSKESWPLEHGRPPIPGLVLYAQVDGGFSVWDPARNSWRDNNPDRPPAYIFSASEVWDGLPLDQPEKFCNGIITDWASWQLENGEAFDQLRRVLVALSPSHEEVLEPGALTKVSLRDARKHPTLAMPYGRDVPLIHASAGVRRIIALAYLLVWSWQEHVAACRLLGDEPVHQIIFLVDEIEAHLHPQWQRRIVPALLAVMNELAGAQVNVQIVTATHSPLVLASVEPSFDEARDVLFHFGMNAGAVELSEIKWAKQGDAVNWLVSSAFGLAQGRSIEAERAIEAAEAFMRGDFDALPASLRTIDSIHRELSRVLAGHDDFWPRWLVETKFKGM